MNWWAAPPKDIERPTLEYIVSRQLSADRDRDRDRDKASDHAEGDAVQEVRWWAELPGRARREPAQVVGSDELVAASSLRCRVLEQPSEKPGRRDELTASEAAEAERAERASKLAEHATTVSSGDVSWQAALEKGGALIVDHPGYSVYQSPQHQIVLLPL